MSNKTCVHAIYTDIDPDDCDFITMLTIIFVAVTAVLLVFGLLNHVLLLYIIVSNRKKMRSTSVIFIANMAVLGLFFLVVVNGGNLVIFGQAAFQVQIIAGSLLEAGLYLTQAFITIATFATLVVMAIDRFMAIVYPFRSRGYRTRRRAILSCGAVWTYSGLCMIPIIIRGGNPNYFEVHEDPDFMSSVHILFATVYVLPLTVITVCYAAILKTVWCTVHHFNQSEDQSKRRWKQRIQTMRTVAVIIISNALHFGYFFAVIMWVAHGGLTRVSERVSNTLLYSAVLVSELNTCVNPPLYALIQSAFRPYVCKILVCPARLAKRVYQTYIISSSTRQSETTK